MQGTFLVVDDLDSARAELAVRGVAVTDVFHFEGSLLRAVATSGRTAGRDPEGRSYFSFASFSDPDGNTWLLQEVTSRAPGRGFSSDPATLTGLLEEAEAGYGKYAVDSPSPRRSRWYAEYVVARERGKTEE